MNLFSVVILTNVYENKTMKCEKKHFHANLLRKMVLTVFAVSILFVVSCKSFRLGEVTIKDVEASVNKEYVEDVKE